MLSPNMGISWNFTVECGGLKNYKIDTLENGPWNPKVITSQRLSKKLWCVAPVLLALVSIKTALPNVIMTIGQTPLLVYLEPPYFMTYLS